MSTKNRTNAVAIAGVTCKSQCCARAWRALPIARGPVVLQKTCKLSSDGERERGKGQVGGPPRGSLPQIQASKAIMYFNGISVCGLTWQWL